MSYKDSLSNVRMRIIPARIFDLVSSKIVMYSEDRTRVYRSEDKCSNYLHLQCTVRNTVLYGTISYRTYYLLHTLERRGAATIMGYDNDRREAPRIKAL